MGLAEQSALLAQGSLTVRQLVSMYLARIERLNPTLKAFVSVRPDAALEEGDRAQKLLAQSEQRPLLGLPFAVKDEHDVAGELTSFGTGACSTVADSDDEIVHLLRSAGAIPIGKTSLSELGMHPFTESPTWGIARNPWELSRTPGGSSGGSAAAVAAGLSSFATASDGGGSLRIPASCCNLFGLKVQRNRFAAESHQSAAGGLSVGGVLARRVADTALLYDLLAGDPIAGGGAPAGSGRSLSAVAEIANPGQLRVGLTFRLGVPAHAAPEVRSVIMAFTHQLEALGHEVVDVEVDPGRWDIPFALLGMRLLVEEAQQLERPKQLDRRTKSALRTGALVNSPVARWAQRRQDAVTAQVNRVFDRLDLVLTPTLALPPVKAGQWYGQGSLRTALGVARWCPFTSLANFIGYPAASVPAGFSGSGLPVGAEFLAPPGGEPTLIAIGAQLEKELRWYDTPPIL